MRKTLSMLRLKKATKKTDLIHSKKHLIQSTSIVKLKYLLDFCNPEVNYLKMNDLLKNENDLAHIVIGLAIDIHKTLGPGLDHDSYLECMMYELEQQGIQASCNIEKDAYYKNLKLSKGYKIDLLIENILVVEVETSDAVSDMQIQKTLKSLKLGGYKLGLIINFNSTLLKNGIRRISNIKPQDEI